MKSWIINNGTLEKYVGEAKRAVVPEDVRQISSYAFQDAPNLRELVITKNVTSLSGRAIYWCKKLERVDIESSELNMAFHIFQ